MSTEKTPASELDPLPGKAVTPDQQRAAEATRKHNRQSGPMPTEERPPIHADYNGWPLDVRR